MAAALAVRRLLVAAFVLAAGCADSHSGDDCDCCGTLVDRPADGCYAGICDPYCPVAPRECDCCGTTVLDPSFTCTDVCEPYCGPPRTCDCCGTTVTVAPGEDCLSGACDPYCVAPPCETAPLALACTAEPRLAGVPSTLDVRMGGDGDCYCDERIECTASLSADGTLELTTAECLTGSFCEACFPWVIGTCELPALPPGETRVNVNGLPGFVLSTVDGDEPGPAASCETPAERDGPCETAWSALAGPTITGTCHPGAAMAGEPIPIRLTNDCAGCELAGPCRVEVDGDRIHVYASRIGFACDIGCDAVCRYREDTCWTPPLDAGTYDVLVESFDSHSGQIMVFDPGVSPPPIPEVCTP